MTQEELKAFYGRLSGKVFVGHNQEKDDDSCYPELQIEFKNGYIDFHKFTKKPTAAMINKAVEMYVNEGIEYIELRVRVYEPHEKYDSADSYAIEELTVFS